MCVCGGSRNLWFVNKPCGESRQGCMPGHPAEDGSPAATRHAAGPTLTLFTDGQELMNIN